MSPWLYIFRKWCFQVRSDVPIVWVFQQYFFTGNWLLNCLVPGFLRHLSLKGTSLFVDIFPRNPLAMRPHTALVHSFLAGACGAQAPLLCAELGIWVSFTSTTYLWEECGHTWTQCLHTFPYSETLSWLCPQTSVPQFCSSHLLLLHLEICLSSCDLFTDW